MEPRPGETSQRGRGSSGHSTSCAVSVPGHTSGLPSQPPPPRACGTRAPLPQAQMQWLWRWRWPGRGWKPRHPDTHHMQGTGTQAHTDRGLPATQRPPPQTLRNTGRLPGRWPLSLIAGQEPQQEKIVQQDSWSQVWGA